MSYVFPYCHKCMRRFDFPGESRTCQMCYWEYDSQVRLTVSAHPLVKSDRIVTTVAGNGMEIPLYVKIISFRPCDSFPHGIIVQRDAFPSWNCNESQLPPCACAYIGMHAVWMGPKFSRIKKCSKYFDYCKDANAFTN